MKNIKFLALALSVFFLASCADENLKPIITFDDAGKGAYPRLISEGDRDINLFDIGNSAYTYSVEFVDLEQGNLVASYDLVVEFEDNNPDNGDNSAGPVALRSYSASDFSSNADGFKALENITVSANDVMSAVGMTADLLGPGDVFKVRGSVTTTDGSVFAASNSSPSVKGAAFRGHFDYNMAASCPTTLDGTYDVITTNTWCGSGDVPYNNQVTFTISSTGYDITDFSFGAYDLCYGATSARPLGSLRFLDICNTIEIVGASQWGEIYTWTNFMVNGTEMSFDWTNDYGEGGSSTVINPSGWPPLTLK